MTSEMEIAYLPAFKDRDGNRLVFTILCFDTREDAEMCHAAVDGVTRKKLGYEPDGIEEAPVAEDGGIWLHHVTRGEEGTPGEEAVIAGPYLDERCKCEHH